MVYIGISEIVIIVPVMHYMNVDCIYASPGLNELNGIIVVRQDIVEWLIMMESFTM